SLKPREMESAARSAGVSEPILAKYRRLSASHTNALESFPILVAALVCGNFAGLRGRVMNTYALGYAVLRIGYNYAYARQETRVVAGMRTVCFWVGTCEPVPLGISELCAD
ncbi:hypothetical protein DACRYDRAFT_51816, partial [Dacryopinax primogenitus]